MGEDIIDNEKLIVTVYCGPVRPDRGERKEVQVTFLPGRGDAVYAFSWAQWVALVGSIKGAKYGDLLQKWGASE